MAAPTHSHLVDSLKVQIYANQPEMAADAAHEVNEYLKAVLARQGFARVILATGNSQIRFLDALIALGGVDWSKVTLFHMDEYLGISGAITRPASAATCVKVEALVKTEGLQLPGRRCAAAVG